MVEKLREMYLLFYFILSLFLMETIFRLSTLGMMLSPGLVYSFIFCIPFAIIFYIICSFFKGKINRILTIILIGLTAFIFCSQLVYFKIFRTFYTLYSAENGEQVVGFWSFILGIVFKNIIWIVLIFAPLILFLVYGRKLFAFEKIDMAFRGCLAVCIVLSHIICLGTLGITGRDQYSPHDLYYTSTYPILSVQKLGLLTTMRLDSQRLVFGWSPADNTAPAFNNSGSSTPTPSGPTVTPSGPSGENQPGEVVKEYNKLDIDFNSLALSEKDKTIQEMDRYFASVQPTAKNQYTGKYKGYNLILITAESFSPYAVRADVTPTLYKMVHEGYYFTNFYNPVWGVSTSDGEYVACTSLIPKSGVWSFKRSGTNYLPFVMGNQLKSLGYKTMAYHDHTYTYYGRNISHPNMGYTYKGVGNGLNVKKSWPESDLEMMQKTIPEYINDQPFHTYYMTVSGHLNYSFSGNAMAAKNKDYVKDLPYSEQGKAYIAAQIELDRAMQYLLDQLEKAGIADKTLIALSPDHYPYGLSDSSINQLAGHTVEKNFELYKSTFILYTEGMQPTTVDKPCSSLDIIPTLSNLLGLNYDSRLLMGRDIFSDSDPLVIFQNKSFITDKGKYNTVTRQFIPADSESTDSSYISQISKIVNDKFYYSARILDTDYYRKILK